MSLQMQDCEFFPTVIHGGLKEVPASAAGADLVLLQSNLDQDITDYLESAGRKIVYWPSFYFVPFHPDICHIYVAPTNKYAESPVHDYQSSIAYYGWYSGLSVEDTLSLFCEPVFAKLGFFDGWNESRAWLAEQWKQTGLSIDPHFDNWMKKDCFCHTVNHPKLEVIGSLSFELAKRLGANNPIREPERLLHDALIDGPIWPVYPDVAKRLGFEGDYVFKAASAIRPGPKGVLRLRDFVEATFEILSKYEKAELSSPRTHAHDSPYADLLKLVREEGGKSVHPYSRLPDYAFWRKAVAEPSYEEVDPVASIKFEVRASDKIATAGSCFAQHISRTLQKEGYHYFTAEAAPAEMAPDEAQRRNFGVFSARYGNVYTVRQLTQLFDRAFGQFEPVDVAWKRADGTFADPFRPQIEPEGYRTVEDLLASRQSHFAAVRQLFQEADLLIFTLGLTEAWERISDGAAFPLAPGVAAGSFDKTLYRFVNYSFSQVEAGLDDFVKKLSSVNAACKIILTLSPVPLIATYEDRHVLVSTAYSKAVLRSAAQSIADRYAHVDYFPSYEIVSGAFNRGRYFGADLRSVTDEGVAHVMRLFKKHYCGMPSGSALHKNASRLINEINQNAKIICDEERLDKFA
jgi:hypothetical protein